MYYNDLFDRTIEAIESILTEEEQDLLRIKRGNESNISFGDQLRVFFEGRQPIYKPETTRVRAAAIMEMQKLNLEKLKMQEEIIQTLSQPTAYYKESTQFTEGDKATGIKTASSTTSTTQAFSQNKARSGTAEHYEEYDILEDGDKADQKTLESLDKRAENISKRDIAHFSTENGKERLAIEESPGTSTIPLSLKEESETTVPLDTLDLHVNRTLTSDITNANNNSGRIINSDKRTQQLTKTYTKAEAIRNLQRYQGINIRELILKSFDCLFRDRRPINPLCL